MKKINFLKGFTLIEIIIYIFLAVSILLVSSSFAWQIIDNKTKASAITEVQQNGRFIIEKLTQEIHQAMGINNNSSFGINLALPENAGRFLSLAMRNRTNNPTVINVLNNFIRMSHGRQPYYQLSSNQVKVTNITFKNYTTGKSSNIKIILTIEYLNPPQRQQYQASDTWQTTVELRDR